MVTLLGAKKPGKRPFVANKKINHKTDMQLLTELFDVLEKYVSPKKWNVSLLDSHYHQILGSGVIYSARQKTDNSFNFAITRSKNNFILSVIMGEKTDSNEFTFGAQVLSALNTRFPDKGYIRANDTVSKLSRTYPGIGGTGNDHEQDSDSSTGSQEMGSEEDSNSNTGHSDSDSDA